MESLQPLAVGGSWTPREIFHICADLFEQAVSRDVTPRRISRDEFLRSEWDNRMAAARRSSEPGQATETLKRGLEDLMRILSPCPTLPPDSEIQLGFSTVDGSVAIALINQPDARTVNAQLRKLEKRWPILIGTNCFLIRDARLPLSGGAKTTHERLEKLRQKQAAYWQPDLSVMAALEALSQFLADAKSGELVYGLQTISPDELTQWLAANPSEPLRAALDELLAPPREPTASREILAQG